MVMRVAFLIGWLVLLGLPLVAESVPLDERPAGASDWGFQPADGEALEVTPPSFSWRPQSGVESWEVECGRGADFETIEYRAGDIRWSVHCPPRPLPAGAYTWRYRGTLRDGRKTEWSSARSFRIEDGAVPMPLPAREDLLARIPSSHPRLFVRPEGLPRLRELAQGDLKEKYESLVAASDRLLRDPPPTEEPRKYPSDMERGTPEWKKLWWGNRTTTIRALDGAATLAFTRLLSGKDEYGQLAKRILLDCAGWDPLGATGYRYNDEAGMPYAYYFSRTYTFIHDLLSEEERQVCRRVMKARGEEMYRHLCPRHLWNPYSSHSNRAWHFLGEVGVAFLGEVEGADDWVWFAMNVFFNVYPVWSDDDGGWHEGVSYWSSYIGRFTWWADVMREAMGIDAYRKPYFSRAGDYAMYLLPPGKVGGGFGDGANKRRARDVVPLMSQLAAQAQNPQWQWWVEQNGGPRETEGYIGFIRGALPSVEPKPPTGLPSSRLFRGIGQAFLNTTILDAAGDVQLLFKSSARGTWSHGSDANNSFILSAYGERLLVRTGHYYNYGGPHHAGWVWSTRSLNNITVNGEGQIKRSPEAQGRIVAFRTTSTLDVVVGEAADAYRASTAGGGDGRLLDRYERAILFVKPDLIIVHDRLVAPKPSTFEYWLHSRFRFDSDDPHKIETRAGDVVCSIDFLAPSGLAFSQTDQYDPNPWPSITEREWHLTASTPERTERIEFVTLYRPCREGERPPTGARLEVIPGGYVLTAELSDGTVTALLPSDDETELSKDGLSTRGAVRIRRVRSDGTVVEDVSASE